MVKTPRTHHSKKNREPVTIDLEAEAVRREPPDTEATEAGRGEVDRTAEDASEEAILTAGAEQTEDRPGTDSAGETASESESAETATGSYETGGVHPGGSVPDDHEPQSRPEAPQQGAASRGPGFGSVLAAGLVGAVIALAAGAALLWSGLVPLERETTPYPEVETLRQELAALQGELAQMREAGPAEPSAEALEQALAEPRQQISELRDTVSALQSSAPGNESAELQRLGQQLAELERRVASAAQSAGEAGNISELERRIGELENRFDDVSQAIDAAQENASGIGQRVDELAAQIAQLSEKVAQEDEGPRLALVVAASSLRSAVERGAPFAGELETYAALAPNAPELDPLRPYAQTGIPTEAELVAEAPQAASRIAASASDLPPDAGLLERLMASARSAVTVRPVGDVEGDTPEAIAARMEAAVQRGDYAQALAEYEALPPAAKEAVADFAEKLRARQAADEVLEKALSGALKPA